MAMGLQGRGHDPSCPEEDSATQSWGGLCKAPRCWGEQGRIHPHPQVCPAHPPPSLPLPLHPLSGVGWDGHVLALAQMVPVSPPRAVVLVSSARGRVVVVVVVVMEGSCGWKV